ncbi:hypothetical protein GUJ93_ZPchr0004g40492 [Zizania palustris]|uniref:Uncharacterized protein n=1 Tax=Zizania palustris TaxID=103762 RepID=A0A8J5S854_ZIZPA|nr:hypothetical protein GUJ93_ZPchr0004g40492 [Zizania palustris]
MTSGRGDKRKGGSGQGRDGVRWRCASSTRPISRFPPGSMPWCSTAPARCPSSSAMPRTCARNVRTAGRTAQAHGGHRRTAGRHREREER